MLFTNEYGLDEAERYVQGSQSAAVLAEFRELRAQVEARADPTDQMIELARASSAKEAAAAQGLAYFGGSGHHRRELARNPRQQRL